MSKLNTYYCFDYTTYTENTAEYGFGDFHDKNYYLMCTVRADTKRKAQNMIKRDRPDISFSGRFSPRLYTGQELEEISYLKKLIKEKVNV